MAASTVRVNLLRRNSPARFNRTIKVNGNPQQIAAWLCSVMNKAFEAAGKNPKAAAVLYEYILSEIDRQMSHDDKIKFRSEFRERMNRVPYPWKSPAIEEAMKTAATQRQASLIARRGQ